MNFNYLLLVNKTRQSTAFFVLLIGLFSNSLWSQEPCNRPVNPMVQSVDTDGATITWTPPTPNPWHGYDYWYTSIQGYFPENGPVPTGHVSLPTVTLNGFTSGATLYVFVRAKCGDEQTGNIHYSQWYGPTSFTTLAPGQGCPNAPYGQKPATTFTPAYTGNPEVINSDAYAGEYARVNIIENRQYIFSSSNTNDYITLTNANLGVVLAYGQTPLTWNSNAYEGELRYYISSNSSCGTQQVNRVRSITGQLVPSNCGSPTALFTHSITATGAVLNWTYASATNGGYQYYYNTSGTAPGINATPSGTTTSNNKTITGLTANTTYYYWIRNVCGSTYSPWIAGGSFTTQATVVSGCTGALYGQDPPNPFTPACTGVPEIISTNHWAGEYTLINVLPNKQYTLTSSVATDFFTIRDELTSVAYASGITPLVWSSGANTTQLRVLMHANSSCGNQSVNRSFSITCQNAVATCASPSSLTIGSITNASANMSWVVANPAPSGGYQYYYSTSNTAPTTATTASGNTASSSVALTGLNANTTYYFWVRSNCGSSQSNWVFGNNFSTVGTSSGCTTAANGLYPAETFTPACFGNTEIIVTDAYAGEYSNVNILPNTQYTFSSSVASDYITIANADASVTYIVGTTPLVWLSGSNSGVITYFLHSNAACGSNNSNRTRSIACQAAAGCNAPSGLSVSGVTMNAATLNWVAASPAPSNGYQYYYSTSNTAPTAATTPSGNTAAISAALSGLAANTAYYYWVRSNCGTSQGNWIAGTTFTTTAVVLTGCTDATFGQYPAAAYTPSCSGSNETIVTNAYAGEYALVEVASNKQYTFTSSVATDFITISNTAGSVIYASGTGPLTWPSGAFSGSVRYYFHSNSACGDDAVDRTRLIRCSAVLANEEIAWEGFEFYPNPVNDMLHISFTQKIDSVEIMNMLGQIVKLQSLHASAATVDVSQLPSGTYFVRAHADGHNKTFKVLKK